MQPEVPYSNVAVDSDVHRPPLRPIGIRRTLTSALVAGLGRPWLWPWALMSFLLRGGIVLFLVPILVVPSTVGVATFIGPLAITPEGPTDRLVGLAVAAVSLLAVWIVGGGLIAAWAEIGLIRETLGGVSASTDDDAASRRMSVGGPLSRHGGGELPRRWRRLSLHVRVHLLRLVGALPLVLASAWGTSKIVTVAYRELTAPVEVTSPLPVRVVAGIGDVLTVIAVAWLIGEIVGGIAVRRMILRDEPLAAALAFGILDVVRHPVGTIVAALIPLAGAVLFIAPSIVAAAIAWGRLRIALVSGLPAETIVLTLLFVAIWSLGLVLAAAAAAWRSAAWTFEALRHRPVETELTPAVPEPGLGTLSAD